MNLCILLLCILWFNSCRESHYLTRSAVVRPAVSAWNMLLYRGDTKSFLNLTGMTREAFYKLESILFIEEAVGRKRGRPPILDNSGRLGLYLFWVGSAMQTKYLCTIFGVVPSSANIIIDNMRSLICRRLQANDRSKIAWPNDVILEEWARLIQNREPTVKYVIGFADGLAIHIKCSDNEIEQTEAYNIVAHSILRMAVVRL